jgi:hypothetical protein
MWWNCRVGGEMARAGCAILAIGLAACSPSMAPLPSRGGPVWIEVKSEHFTVWTDTKASRGSELIRELERRRQIVARAMNRAAANEHTFVIALHSAWETAAYLPKRIGAMALFHKVAIDPTLVLSADDNGRDHLVSHVLTYVISRSVLRQQPTWLAEGIATYFEMADLESDAASVTVGMPRADRLRLIRTKRTLSLRELLSCRYEDRCRDERFAATAWALFSYLLNERLDQLADYLRRLDSPATAARAWNEAFAGVSYDDLERGLARWMVNGDLRLPRIAVTLDRFPSAVRQLGDADVLAARGMLEHTIKNNDVAAQAAADAALSADRTNVLAHLVEFALSKHPTPDAARAIALAHPEDWRAWWLVAEVVPHTAEAVQAHDRICALAPTTAQSCAPM